MASVIPSLHRSFETIFQNQLGFWPGFCFSPSFDWNTTVGWSHSRSPLLVMWERSLRVWLRFPGLIDSHLLVQGICCWLRTLAVEHHPCPSQSTTSNSRYSWISGLPIVFALPNQALPELLDRERLLFTWSQAADLPLTYPGPWRRNDQSRCFPKHKVPLWTLDPWAET